MRGRKSLWLQWRGQWEENEASRDWKPILIGSTSLREKISKKRTTKPLRGPVHFRKGKSGRPMNQVNASFRAQGTSWRKKRGELKGGKISLKKEIDFRGKKGGIVDGGKKCGGIRLAKHRTLYVGKRITGLGGGPRDCPQHQAFSIFRWLKRGNTSTGKSRGGGGKRGTECRSQFLKGLLYRRKEGKKLLGKMLTEGEG